MAIDVVDPATGEAFAEAPEGTSEQLDTAFAAAAAAQPGWAADEDARRRLMITLAEAIVGAGPELTALLIRETGKPTALADVEIVSSDAWLRYYAGVEIPRTLVSDDDAARIEMRRRPLGVVAGITPWNFPLGQALWKIAPAMRAGNTIVLKPSPFTPLAALRLGEIANEVLPPGVVAVLSGGDELGAAMVAHPVPRKVSLTGSIGAGKRVAAAAGADLKRMTLELGGNDAAVLLDDVDLAAAIPAVLGTATFNSGQVCAIPKRVYVPRALYGEALDAFAAGAEGIALGAGDEGQMGPLSTRPQFERVSGLVAEALAGGARAVTGGAPAEGPGFFYPATIIADAEDSMRIVAEEQFGPALPILPYDDVEEALGRANSTMYGLCGSVWGSDAERATELAERLECGVTYVNSHAELPPYMPLLGAKWSGLGVENGLDGLLAQTERQVVYRAA